MRYDGVNGQVTIEDAQLAMEREGPVARATFAAGTRWQLSLRAVSGVEFEDASPLHNGWLRVLVGGLHPVPLTRASVGCAGDAVVFTHEQQQIFAPLSDWLAHVAATNESSGADYNAVPWIAALPGRSEAGATAQGRPGPVLAAAAPAVTLASKVGRRSSPFVRNLTEQPPPATRSRGLAGQLYVLRGRGYPAQQVAGESHYERHLKALSGKGEGERQVTAVLQRDPGNAYDRNAVQVRVDGSQVGFLPREDAPTYLPALRLVEAMGNVPAALGRLWWHNEPGDFMASVSLDLDDPALLVPINTPDITRPHVLLPAGRSYQVSGENEHMDVLREAIGRAYVPGRAFAYASLALEDVQGSRAPGNRVVVVRFDGRTVGRLSTQSGGKLLPILEPLAARSIPVYVEAKLVGNALAVEVSVFLTMAGDLPPALVSYITSLIG